MLSKEEIEKILDQNEDIITYKADKDFRGLTSSEKTLLENNKKIKEYIAQLEQENNKQSKIIDEMADSFYRLYQKIPGTMHKFFENGKPCEYGYDKETNDCKEINCKPCIKQYFEKKVDEKNNV